MSASDIGEWNSLLLRLNSLLFNSPRWEQQLTPQILSERWCGSPAASEELLSDAEDRLGVRLPPSYRSFLSVANGWRPFSSFIERLLPLCEVDWFRFADPECLADIQKYYREDDISDEEYSDYETARLVQALRHRYYPDCLLVGKGWYGDMVLMNSKIVFPNGEWETLFFANWIPGNHRYRSFREFVESSVKDQITFENEHQQPS